MIKQSAIKIDKKWDNK